jgi:hypothetical protein
VDAFEARMEPTEEARVSCPECRKTFRTAAALRKHLPKHRAATLRCPREGCTRLFKWPQTVREHARTRHERGSQHRCRSCNKLQKC